MENIKEPNNHVKLEKATKFSVIIISVVFLLVISFPVTDEILNLTQEPPNMENREFASFPEFDIQFMDPYPRAFTSWFNDNLNARGYLMKGYRTFKSNALRTQAFNSTVVKGKEGWMYWMKNSIDDYRGTNRFTLDELSLFEREFVERTDWCR